MDKSIIAAAVQRSTLPSDQSSDRPLNSPSSIDIVPAHDEDNLDYVPSGDSSIQDEHSSEPFTDALLQDVDYVDLHELFDSPDWCYLGSMAVANDATIHNTFPDYLETLDTVSIPQAAYFLSTKKPEPKLPKLIGPVETIDFDDPGLFNTIYIN